MIGTRTRRVNACSRTGSAATRAPARARRPLPARSIPRPSWRRGPASRGRRASGSARAPRRQVAPPGRGRPCWATAWRTMRRAPRRRAAWPRRPLPGPLAVRTGEAFELEARGRLAEQVCQRVGHGVERVAGDAAPGRDVDGDARGVPRQPVELEVDVAPLDPVERISACPARDGAGQDAGVLAGDDRVARAVAEYGGVDFERLHGVSFRFQGDRGPETGPLSDVSSMAYTLKAPRLTCRPCASRRHRSPRGRMPPPSGARPRRRRPGRRTRYRWAMPSPHHAWRSPRR